MNVYWKNLLIGIIFICVFLFTGCNQAEVIILQIQSMTTALVICICFIGIVFVIWASLFKIKNRHIAIFVSTVASCIIMIPLIISLNHYVRKQAAITIIEEEETKIALLRADYRANVLEQQRLEDEIRHEKQSYERVRQSNELERQRLENEILIAKQSIEIEALNKKNMLLERAKLQIQGFQQIAELALTQANLNYTLIRQEPTTPVSEGWNIRAEYYHDEVLVVSNYNINAKFGIDLKEVKVIKTAEDSVIVSGINPKYIGADTWERRNLIKEIRRVEYKYGNWFRSRILDAAQNRILADNKEQQFDLEFSQRVKNGMELVFMDDVIFQLAQNFIKIVLAPVYNNIVFDNVVRPNSLPLMDFLTQESREVDMDKINLLQMNENIIHNLQLHEIENDEYSYE